MSDTGGLGPKRTNSTKGISKEKSGITGYDTSEETIDSSREANVKCSKFEY